MKVTELDALVLAGLKLAVTPEGRPEAARLTLPLNPLAPTTVMVELEVDPAVTERVAEDEVRLKLDAGAGAETVKAMAVEAVKLPDAPLIVAVYVPAGAELAAVNVTVLDVLVLAGLKLAVTPEGRPEAFRMTLPLNPLAPTTVTAELELDPAVTERVAEDEVRLKLGEGAGAPAGAETVTANTVEAVILPEVPVTVAVYIPAATELAAVNVTVLDVLVLAGLKPAVTPDGRPEAARLTLPLNPLVPTTVMVELEVDPAVKEAVAEDEVRLKLGAGAPAGAE